MGKSITCNYQIQVENPVTGHLTLQGAMRYKEALELLFEEGQRLGSSKAYIWPQTVIGRKKIKSDFLEVDITINTPENKKYTVTHKDIETLTEKMAALKGSAAD